MTDLPKRVATIAIGFPLVISLLSNRNYSVYLLQASHLLCAIEWTRLAPSSAEPSSAEDDFVTKKILPFFPIVSLLLSTSKHPFILISVLFPILFILPNSSSASQQKNQQQQNHILHGLLFLSVGYHYLLRISSSSFSASVLFLMIVWNCDTGALIGGRLARSMFGGDPLGDLILGNAGMNYLKEISPKKSVSGMVGGIILGLWTSIYLPSVIHVLHPYFPSGDLDTIPVLFSSLSNRFVVGIILSLSAILGDLVESKVKRNAKVSDSGAVLPGHGGVLDRMDSCLISAAVYFWCVETLL